ncbi:hypothetical protein EDD22DRAFT_957459 [Suillus occidentalis]|nr:hypothetical protein EDD22DRAFT_957459 [Suillus occidentalis]
MSQSNIDLHFAVAAGVVLVHDWVLTVGQEIELIWKQRWSLMTVLYLLVRTSYYTITSLVVVLTPKCARYAILEYLILLPMFCICLICTVFDSSDRSYTVNVTFVSLPDAMLQVIMIARLHAMYQGSRTMLLFLVIIFLAVNIACVVLVVISLKTVVAEEGILSGVHMCGYSYEGDVQLLVSMVWMLNTVWEVLALCLAVWIAVKHFRDLRRLGPSTGSMIGDCFRVLIQSHVLYFASFAGVSCFQLISLSPAFLNSSSTAAMIFAGTRAVLEVVQMFVLGPRLILSVREYHAKLVAGSDTDTSMNSIVFQEHVHISTSGTV